MRPFNAFFLLLLLFLFPVFSLVSCGSRSKPEKEKPKQPQNQNTVVDVMVTMPREISNTVEANGTVIAYESTELRPEVSGRLTYLNVPEGRQVAQGSVLARVNNEDLVAQMQKSKVQLELAQTTEARLRKLLDVNGINQSDYDNALNQVNSLKADIAYTQTLIDKTILRAPFSGTIGLRRVSPGAYVTPLTVIATLQQVGKAKVDFTIPEEYSDLVQVNDIVDVEVDASKEVKEKARVIAVEPQANTQTRNLVVRALLEKAVPNPGAFVKVYVGSNADAKKAIMIPTNTIIPDDKNNQVIVVKGGKANFVNVKTGLRLANNVEITQGLNVGDTIVVTGVLFARPNSPLKIRSVKTLEQLGE